MSIRGPSRRDRPHGPRRATLLGSSVELATGALLLALAALAGLALIHRPWANRLDLWGFRFLPADRASSWAQHLVTLGSLTVLVVGVVVIFLVGVFRDWVRALACSVAPVVAVLIVQDLAKPLVGRHLGLSAASSYPSGTVAAVAALATAAILVSPRMLRPLVGLAGVGAVVGVCAAVIVLRWHYPTDALGGLAVGMGAVLTVDALFHLPWAIAAAVHPLRSADRRFEPQRHPLAA